MIQTLEMKGIKEFCLDSGYASAQKIWRKKFGEPDNNLESYWGESYHHQIWKVKTSEFKGIVGETYQCFLLWWTSGDLLIRRNFFADYGFLHMKVNL